MALTQDTRGRIWAGTEDSGIWCLDPSAPLDQRWTQFTCRNTAGNAKRLTTATAPLPQGLGDDNGYALACDKLGRIWVGHLNHGVSVYDGRPPEKSGSGSSPAATYQGWRNYDVLSGPLGERVFDIEICPVDGDVWIATSAGLTRYSVDTDTWSHYTRADGLASDSVEALAFASDGTIFAATSADGLLISTPVLTTPRAGTPAAPLTKHALEYKSWRNVRGNDQMPLAPGGVGLPSNLLNDVLVTADGTLWVATPTGLAWSLDRGQSFRFLRGREWRDRARGLYQPPPDAQLDAAARLLPRGAELLLEDYVTCLGADSTGHLWVGHRQFGYEVLDTQSLRGSGQGLPRRLFASGDNAGTPLRDFDYVTRILGLRPDPAARAADRTNSPAGKSARAAAAPLAPAASAAFAGTDCFVGWYRSGLTQGVNPTAAPIEGLASNQQAVVPEAGIQATPSPLPSPAQAPDLAEFNSMLAQLAAMPPAGKPALVVPLTDDWRTQGNWLGRYGRHWACLSAICSPNDYIWGAGWEPVQYSAYIGPHHQPKDSLRYWIHTLYTANEKTLEMPPTYLHSRILKNLTTWERNRRQAEWDDHGETYPTTYEGPDVYVKITVPAGPFVLSLYDFNKDGHEGKNRFRDFPVTVSASSGSGKLMVAPEMARSRIHDFWGGVWKRFLVRGPTQLTVKVARNGSMCTLLAGVALDPLEEEPEPYFPPVAAKMAVGQGPTSVWPAAADTLHFSSAGGLGQFRRPAPLANAVGAATESRFFATGFPAAPRTVAPLLPPDRKSPAQSEAAAVDRLIAELAALRLRDPATWASISPACYTQLLRWCRHQAETEPESGASRAYAARLGSSCYALHLFPDWEECQKARGLMPARDIEKALRWDPQSPFCEGKGYDIVKEYLAHRPAELAQRTSPAGSIGH